jgi:mxaJ protein
MSFAFLKPAAAIAGLLFAAAAAGATAENQGVLRVCADPDGLPYSRRDESGFENRIARLVAADLHLQLQFVWQPLQRGFARKTLTANLCDALFGVPARYEPVLTTQPYYRSRYVFVYRDADRYDDLRSFDDPRLSQRAIAVPVIGDDLVASPPGYALAARGMTNNVVGYPVLGATSAAERAIADLVERRIDLAILWGPQAAYFARRPTDPIGWSPAPALRDGIGTPFDYAIAVAVRKNDEALATSIGGAIARQRAAIDAILEQYDVPRTVRAEGEERAAR